jgi:hypothetical protein
MSDIQYDEPQYAQPAALSPQKKPSWLTGMLLRLHVAKNERSANTLLVIVILFCIVAMFVVIHANGAPQQNLNVPLGPPAA